MNEKTNEIKQAESERTTFGETVEKIKTDFPKHMDEESFIILTYKEGMVACCGDTLELAEMVGSLIADLCDDAGDDVIQKANILHVFKGVMNGVNEHIMNDIVKHLDNKYKPSETPSEMVQ